MSVLDYISDCWILGSTKTSNEKDYDNVHTIKHETVNIFFIIIKMYVPRLKIIKKIGTYKELSRLD